MLIVKQIFGIILLVFSAFGLVAVFSGAENYYSTGSVTGMGAFILGLALGVWLVRTVRKQKVARRLQHLEQDFPNIISENPELSPAALSRQNKIPRKAAKEFLERKAAELPSTIRADNKGGKTYRFDSPA